MKQPLRRDRGAVWIQVILLVFAILAVASLTVDLGLAALTQDQMQVATDSGALEGVRWRDSVDDDTRRDLAAAMIGVVFDDDLSPDPLDPDPDGFGAGPIIRVVAQTPGLGGGTFDLSGPTVYKPNAEGIPLALNQGNLPHGDFVAGSYFDGPGVFHVESADYDRDDFVAEDSGDAFLARLRRTNDALSLDQDAGISSSGPSLPLLFGLGSLVSSAPGSPRDIRTDGINVRSTSIAAPRRALRVSSPASLTDAERGALGIFALAPIALRSATWEGLTPGVAVDVPLGSYVPVSEADATLDAGTQVDFVGEPVVSSATLPAFAAVEAVVPVIADVDSDGIDEVVGFGLAQLGAIAGGAPPATLSVTRRAGRLPRSGVDAKDLAALRALAASAPLRAAHATMSAPLLAAVLVR